MDINAIRAKLDSLNNSGQQKEKTDYSEIFWKPQLGKQTLRIVPSAFDPAFPFKELKFHYGIGKYPMIALSNFGKQDPIEEFVKELRKTSDRDNWSLAGKIQPKTRIFAPVVVRGEEDKGVRLWGFGVTIYKALLALAEDEDVGDYTDVINGWDLVVEQQAGNPYPETSVRIKPKQTELSDKNDLVDKWIKTQPNPEEVFTQYDYDFIKKQLQGYLNPGSEEQSNSPTTATPKPESTSPPKTDFTLETATAGNKDTVSKFDDLFNE
jgi:hypothetical protein|tara:strand:+ start:812 stop:1609 length:798 start_codon:yes stop_codon:yes gene_type:complete